MTIQTLRIIFAITVHNDNPNTQEHCFRMFFSGMLENVTIISLRTIKMTNISYKIILK